MSESLRNDGRIWVPRSTGDTPAAGRHPGGRARLLPGARCIPSFGNLAPRDIASRAAKRVCDEGRGVGPGGHGVYLDFADAIGRLGRKTIEEKYGNLFEMYERITGEDPYRVPMRIYPATHYTMGGLWVDYDLMSTHPRAVRDRRGQLLRPRRQPAGRQRAHAGAGRRLLHPAVHDRQLPGGREARRRRGRPRRVRGGGGRGRGRVERLLAVQGRRTVTSFHRELGKLMWDYCGMARTRRA